MEKEELQLAQDWEKEKTWELDGITVLRAAVTLPQLGGSSRRARRFNRYYRRLAGAYFVYCEQMLLPYARAQCRAAMETSAPWTHTQAEMHYKLMLQSSGILSLSVDASEHNGPVPRLTLRRADTWDTKSMLPIPLSEWFPPHTPYRRRLIRFARETAAEQTERGLAVYHENCRTLLRSCFSGRNYYVSGEGLHFFYPMYAVAPAAEGIVVFTLGYDAENGPFAPKE